MNSFVFTHLGNRTYIDSVAVFCCKADTCPFAECTYGLDWLGIGLDWVDFSLFDVFGSVMSGRWVGLPRVKENGPVTISGPRNRLLAAMSCYIQQHLNTNLYWRPALLNHFAHPTSQVLN